MGNDYIEVDSNGSVSPKKGKNSRSLYDHQRDAIKNLDLMDQLPKYSTLVVLPTGGGKTYTASLWLLKNALNKHKKILWIAHRQMLLDQAAESFKNYAYTEVLPNISSFYYRIVSGASKHDRTIDISPDDNLLIVSKDSIGRNLAVLDKWLNGENEVFLVIDEAHHSTAKTYRKIINYVKERAENTKILGLTATPFRTAENEQGLLSKIYTDGVSSGKTVQGNIGIAYQIGLKDLINRRILSKPIFESCYTEATYGESLGVDDWERIANLDVLPEDIVRQMTENKERNKLIVKTYTDNRKKYGQTIVFASGVDHAIALSHLFNKAGVKSDFVVSDIKDMVTGVTISREENERKIEEYRNGEIQVLVNVNILTEGIDLPQTKTVFLARPTTSTILMTQMVGRALRGEAAKGTAEAYIVTFIDNWNEHIAWVNPESLFIGPGSEFIDNESDRQKYEVRLIAISKIEEFAAMLDDSVDTTALENTPFEKRIPVGMYAFTYLEENGMDHSYQVMVYDSTMEAYKGIMESLPELFSSFEATDEYLQDNILHEMAEQIRSTYFLGEMIPPYEERDVIEILKYYAQYEDIPKFYTFDAIDKSKLDVAAIARHIYDNNLSRKDETDYIESLWENTDENILKLFFGRKIYFYKQLFIEQMRLQGLLNEDENNVKPGKRYYEDMSLSEIGKIDPNYEKELRDQAFKKATDRNGNIKCAICGKKAKTRIPFQVDHLKPLNKGGKTVPENLQILCKVCNGKKGDK